MLLPRNENQSGVVDDSLDEPKQGCFLGNIQNNVEELRVFRPVGVVSMGGTDARLWRYKGIPAYVYGPTPTGMGSFDENVPVDDYLHLIRTHALSAYDYLSRS